MSLGGAGGGEVILFGAVANLAKGLKRHFMKKNDRKEFPAFARRRRRT